MCIIMSVCVFEYIYIYIYMSECQSVCMHVWMYVCMYVCVLSAASLRFSQGRRSDYQGLSGTSCVCTYQHTNQLMNIALCEYTLISLSASKYSTQRCTSHMYIYTYIVIDMPTYPTTYRTRLPTCLGMSVCIYIHMYVRTYSPVADC